jgi:hypothetical protein
MTTLPRSNIYIFRCLFLNEENKRQKDKVFLPGLPDFSWYIISKPGKIYQMNTKCTKLS